MYPSVVEAITDIFQLVMLSAMANLSSARPEESVTNSGCQTSVSGKYFRNRGVNACCWACTRALEPANVLVTCAEVVSTRVAWAVTSTVSEVVPTASRASTLVRLDELTGTALTTELRNPWAKISTLYWPAGRL